MGPFTFPDIDPIAVQIGPVAIRWYALAYIAGLVGGWQYALRLARRAPNIVSPRHIDDFMVWATVGVVLGGRLGYVIFYQPAYFLDHPGEILQVWKGGMSFHGGLLGVILAMYLFGRRRGTGFFPLADIIAAATPIGLFFGRIANFINGELWGRVTDVPWGVIFPRGGPEPRHPSQLYEAGLEGLLLFVVLAVLVFRFDALRRPSLVSGTFLVGYGLARIIVETVREPDTYTSLMPLGTTFGQWLSLPMVLYGLYLIWTARHRPPGLAASRGK
ncbi:MAG: prolipoprotein diacylglyceryl transferase [Alphaproteobacteria bacterium]|nr:prolipoprotein diacylglyceryl transferase [Alphaproteobacteria bacterium]